MVGFLLVTALIAVVAYGVDVARRPWRRHWRCNGTGRVRVRGNRYDDCRGCDGGRKPRSLRWAAKFVRPDLARKK